MNLRSFMRCMYNGEEKLEDAVSEPYSRGARQGWPRRDLGRHCASGVLALQALHPTGWLSPLYTKLCLSLTASLMLGGGQQLPQLADCNLGLGGDWGLFESRLCRCG